MIKIGELSKLSGVSIQTIRFYEEKGLICPAMVDRWTNYRYYDENSLGRLSEIARLKDLGFSLNEIKDINEKSIQEKIVQSKETIKKLKENIHKLSSIHAENGGVKMKSFINDEAVIGKWKKVAVVKTKEDFAKNKFEKEVYFPFEELYFLPNGQEYWVLSWSKGVLYVNDRQMPYEIIDGKLFVGVVDYLTNEIDNFAVYEKVDDKIYTKNEIRIKDNTDIPFILDEEAVGFWDVVDFVEKKEQFDPNKPYWQEDMFLKRYTFMPDGTMLSQYYTFDDVAKFAWSRGVVIDRVGATVSEYQIVEKHSQKYMIVEWKSGDYIYGGKVNGYYVLKKIG